MTLPVVVVGLDHGSAPVELRERLAVPESRLPAALADLLAHTGLGEALLLATCNRVEVWGLEQGGDAAAAVTRWLAAQAEAPPAELAGLLYVRRGLEAVAHMASVAAGLDSMVIGEPQILGQVKAAHATAAAQGAVGPVLGDAVGQALRIAKRVRTETEVGRGAVSVSYAAVELARKIFGDLRERTVVLLGAGEMGGLAARHLADLGVSRLVITSRTTERAEAIARETGGKAVAFEDFPRHAASADILICAATAPGVLVTQAHVAAWVASRPRPLFIIDLGVPRNVDRAASRVADVYLYDIDDLQGVVEANRRAREREVERARALVADAVARVGQATAARTAAPTIRSLRAKLEEIRQGEVERAVARLGERGPEVRAALDAMTTTLVNKILHGPIEQLKAAQAAPGGARLRALVRELFGLEREDEGPETRQEES
ncbi:MAG: glutamyl-tRNA reductase [Candidatus Rokubacteria bacterium]|nr:glutamyl-tRNA reductase [Candidatus Rokubacteria bacterium]